MSEALSSWSVRDKLVCGAVLLSVGFVAYVFVGRRFATGNGALAAATQPRPRSPSRSVLPHWSCGSAKAPLGRVPLEHLAATPLRTREGLASFVSTNEVPLYTMYNALLTKMHPADKDLHNCIFQDGLDAKTPVQIDVAWTLDSNGSQAKASGFSLRGVVTPDRVARERASECLNRSIVGREFVAVASENAPFVRYKGLFPFYRRFRFNQAAEKPSPEDVTAMP